MCVPADDQNPLKTIVRWLSLLAACVVGFLAPVVSAEVDPLEMPYTDVAYTGDETLRDFVARYLKDPDLWPTVLQINKVTSPADLVPGAVLQMPVAQVAAADAALAEALVAIQKATSKGARLFAPQEIGAAISDREMAIGARSEGAWRKVVSFAGSATGHATEAFEIALAQRDRAAEALITDIHGRVEGREPAEAAWSGRGLNDVLIEFEKVRTLTNSTTQVTFRDLSRLRLNPNSNATIQRMRSDPLTGKEVTKVSLANGDFYALLNQLSDRDSFEIDVPGIQTTTDSDDFWIKKEADKALFVNYDTASLDIEADATKVSLGQDEGVVITKDGIATRAQVLEWPLLSAPMDRAEVYGAGVWLAWQQYPEASGYWFEVAGDPAFNQMIATEWGVKELGFDVAGLAPGAHFWRVAALDGLGLPGKWSEVRRFEMRQDSTPPFLTLLAPAEGVLVEVPEVAILGASEAGVALTLNGAKVEVAADGGFVASVTLTPGANQIVLVATDPAGNVSEKREQLRYVPRVATTMTLNPDLARNSAGHLVSRNAEMTVVAATSAKPGQEVILRNSVGSEAGRTRISVGGVLAITVPVADELRAFSVEVLSEGGVSTGTLAFAMVWDSAAPELVLDVPPPRATSEKAIDLKGTLGDAVMLELNGANQDIFDGSFAIQAALVEGQNLLELRAVDAAGNVGVLLVETVLDLSPPEILNAGMTRPQGEDGPVEIVVAAQDVSGLRQAAPFLVEVGDEEFEGYLRCDSARGICRASLPPTPGKMRLIEVVVQDYAGNEVIR
ncbi:MAG: FecR domain-containing protein [Shimia sp.]|nr:FecR domain-containing protein [Shimia sp.]